MSARRDALIELLAKVEAGDSYDSDQLTNYDIIGEGFGFQEHYKVIDAWRGSLDAALALHEAVLPDFSWSVSKHDRACVSRHADPDDITTWIEESAQSANPARAWLIAILKALIAEAAS